MLTECYHIVIINATAAERTGHMTRVGHSLRRRAPAVENKPVLPAPYIHLGYNGHSNQRFSPRLQTHMSPLGWHLHCALNRLQMNCHQHPRPAKPVSLSYSLFRVSGNGLPTHSLIQAQNLEVISDPIFSLTSPCPTSI